MLCFCIVYSPPASSRRRDTHRVSGLNWNHVNLRVGCMHKGGLCSSHGRHCPQPDTHTHTPQVAAPPHTPPQKTRTLRPRNNDPYATRTPASQPRSGNTHGAPDTSTQSHRVGTPPRVHVCAHAGWLLPPSTGQCTLALATPIRRSEAPLVAAQRQHKVTTSACSWHARNIQSYIWCFT